MVHYTCDMCGKDIVSRDDHFLVHIEIRPANPALQLTKEDMEEDHLQQIDESITDLEACGEECLQAHRTLRVQRDLCLRCREDFAKNPMRESIATKLKFSEN